MATKGDIKVTIEMRPTAAELEATFGEAAKAFEDWRPALRGVAPLIARSIGANIASQGGTLGPDWAPWPKLNETYLHRKLRDGFAATPLIRTGATAAEATKATPVSLTKKSVSMGIRGANWKHAPKLQFKDGRAFVTINPAAQADITERLAEYMQQALDAAARRMNAAGQVAA